LIAEVPTNLFGAKIAEKSRKKKPPARKEDEKLEFRFDAA
jgi:hypothetical protein